VLVLASGSATHNFQANEAHNKKFMTALGEAVEQPQAKAEESPSQARTRQAGLEWEKLPSARMAHPEEDHLVPLFVALGAAEADQPKGKIVGKVVPGGSWQLASVLFE